MREITIAQEPDGSWCAVCAEIPGYVARGSTRHMALLAMKRALSLYYPCGECTGEEAGHDGPAMRRNPGYPNSHS